MVRRHLNLDPVVLELVRKFAQLGFPVLETALSHRITYQEAFAQGMGVQVYDPCSKAAEEVQALFREVQAGL
jgi:cellulose biosynthesis protein BcsQ